MVKNESVSGPIKKVVGARYVLPDDRINIGGVNPVDSGFCDVPVANVVERGEEGIVS